MGREEAAEDRRRNRRMLVNLARHVNLPLSAGDQRRNHERRYSRPKLGHAVRQWGDRPGGSAPRRVLDFAWRDQMVIKAAMLVVGDDQHGLVPLAAIDQRANDPGD